MARFIFEISLDVTRIREIGFDLWGARGDGERNALLGVLYVHGGILLLGMHARRVLFCVCALLMMSCLFISGGNHRVNYVSFIRRWS